MALGEIQYKSDPPYPVPEWLVNYVEAVRNRLLLHAWEIRVQLARVVDGEPDCQGAAEIIARYNIATITFSSEIEDTTYWHNVVKHEVLEVAFGHIGAFVKERLAEDMPNQQFIIDLYDDYKDRLIRSLEEAIAV